MIPLLPESETYIPVLLSSGTGRGLPVHVQVYTSGQAMSHVTGLTCTELG
jgi:hypothetical protein